MTNRTKKERFTLIELLAVVAIASIMIAIFVPLFNRMMFGSKVEQAASNFKLGLEMAQSQAISARRYVAMIIPTRYGDASASLKPYCDGGYRLAFVKKSGSTTSFVDWISGSSWRNPRDGAALTEVNGSLRSISGSSSSVGSDDSDKEDWDRLGHADNRKAVVFSPYGGTDGNEDFTFTFVEAKSTGNVENDKAVYEISNADNKLALYVKGITGRVKYQ